MKKFLSLAILTLLFSCSSDGFKEPKQDEIANWAKLDSLNKDIITCLVVEGSSASCYEVSKTACVLIGGKQAEEDYKCIKITTCKWERSNVKYGEESSLKFGFDSAGQEDCTWDISYGNKKLQTDTNYTIAPSTFSGLSYSEKTDIIAKATLTCKDNNGKDQRVSRDCDKLEVNPISVPDFTCYWSFRGDSLKYGGTAALVYDCNLKGHDCSFLKDHDCSFDASYGNVALKTDTNYTFSSSTFSGLSYSKETSIVAKVKLTCENEISLSVNCDTLKVNPIPGPEPRGSISFKKKRL